VGIERQKSEGWRGVAMWPCEAEYNRPPVNARRYAGEKQKASVSRTTNEP